MQFAQKMINIKQELESHGHQVVIPKNSDKYASGTMSVENKWEKIELDLIKNYFEEIKKTDAVLIINENKNGVENYIGGNGLIEMAFAHILNKKIYLLNPVPKLNYTDEIEAMQPIIINNDLKLII